MSNTNRITADEIKSAVTVSPDYRRAIVNGRRFDMTKTTHRAGHYGRRYTATEWLITERNEDGSLKQSVHSFYGASTIKAAHRCIAKHINDEQGQEVRP